MDLIRTRWFDLGLLFAGHSIVVGITWFLRTRAIFTATWVFVAHLLLAGLLLFGANKLKSCRVNWVANATILVPWVLWLTAWSEIGWLYETSAPVFFDEAIINLDLVVFGSHLNDYLPRQLAGPVWREFFTGIYFSYYLLILGPPLVLVIRRRWSNLLDHTFGLMLTYLICFTIYLILPVQGPRDMALVAGTLAEADFTGFFPPLMDALFRSGDSLGTAFPSSHCAGAVASAILCCRFFSARIGLACLVWASLIVVSTIHTNNHYAIDSLAGVALAQLVGFREAYHAKGTRYWSHRIHRQTSGASTRGARI